MIDKGCDVSGERRALGLLAEAGISYIAIVMAGIAGKGRSEESVAATVQLLNGFPPTTIGIMTTSVVPGSNLADLRDSGAYVELTEREILEEELLYLESLEVPDSTFFWAMHTFDLVPLADSMAHRDAMIARLKDVLAHGDPRILDQTLNRGSI